MEKYCRAGQALHAGYVRLQIHTQNVQYLLLLHYKKCCTTRLNLTLNVQDGSNMTGTDLCVNKPHCAAAVRP